MKYTVIWSDVQGALEYQHVEAATPSKARLKVYEACRNETDRDEGVEYYYPGLVFTGWLEETQEEA